MSMTNCIFRCDYDEKNRFVVEAERMELDASFLLRRMVHLSMTDKPLRERVLNLATKEENERNA